MIGQPRVMWNKRSFINQNLGHYISVGLVLFANRQKQNRNRRDVSWVIDTLEPASLVLAFYLLKGGGVIALPSTLLPYFYFICCGVLGYYLFSQTVISSMTSVARNVSIINSFNTSFWSLVLSEFLISLRLALVTVVLVLLCAVSFSDGFSVVGIVTTVGLWLLLCAWGLLIGFFLLPFQLVNLNTTMLAGIALRFGMFMSGVFFVSPANGGLLGEFMQYNPIAILLDAVRMVLWGDFEAIVNTKFLLVPIGALLILVPISCRCASTALIYIRRG